MLTVKDILYSKAKPFNTITPTMLVIDALSLMNVLNISFLIVMQDEEYKGIFCEKDYSRNVILKGRKSETTVVQDVMTTDIPIVLETDTIERCMKLMNTFKTRYLLAYNDDGEFKGVITINDLLSMVVSSRENVFDSAEFIMYESSSIEIF